jgi:hypothetical protein
MNICSNNHEEVAYESRKCPVCELIGAHEEHISLLKETRDEWQESAETYKKDWQNAIQEVERLCKGRLDGEQ